MLQLPLPADMWKPFVGLVSTLPRPGFFFQLLAVYTCMTPEPHAVQDSVMVNHFSCCLLLE